MVSIGQTYGLLTVVARAPRDKHLNPYWVCACACGGSSVVQQWNLIRTDRPTTSCGCRQRTAAKRHGMRGSDVYRIWQGIVARCCRPRAPGYQFYGQRGITIAPAWRASFPAFYADVGPRPSAEHTIDRIDGTRGYVPGNVRWATLHEQSRNRRDNVRLTFQGETMVLMDWAIRYGMQWETLKGRLNSGWTVEDALTTPVRRYA